MAEEVTEDSPEKKTQEEELDLDEDLASALDSGEEGGAKEEDVDVDAAIMEADPNFASEIDAIAQGDFSEAKIDQTKASDEVDEQAKVPSPYRAFINNLPKEIKQRYSIAALVVVTLLPFAAFIYYGYILPNFEIPYTVSMSELTEETFTYPVEGVKVPLFDEFRTKAHTVQLPKTVINLDSGAGGSAYGEFEFSLVLRDKEMSTAIEAKQSEIIDVIQRVLEQISAKELESPLGKEKVKKIIRHRLNDYLQGKVILGVYYQSIIVNQ